MASTRWPELWQRAASTWWQRIDLPAFSRRGESVKLKEKASLDDAQPTILDYNHQRDIAKKPQPANADTKKTEEKRTVTDDEVKPPSRPKLKQYRKRSFYAVAKGHNTGVVASKKEVDEMTIGFPGLAIYKKFESKQAAQFYWAVFKNLQKSLMMMKHLGVSAAIAPDSKDFAGAETTAGVDAQLTEISGPDDGWWYAVAKGRKTGTWNETKQYVENMFSAKFKKFPTKEQAEAFVNQHAASTKRQEGDPDPKDPNTLVAFWNGSAVENGRRKCRAGYACNFPHNEGWNVAKRLVEERATNNRAEYMAALEAMKRANLENPDGSRMLYIFSDSMLLIRSMTEWVGTWQKNNWMKSDGAPVQNRDLLELLMSEKGDRRIRWAHVKAHTRKKDWRSKWNNVADKAARNATRPNKRR